MKEEHMNSLDKPAVIQFGVSGNARQRRLFVRRWKRNFIVTNLRYQGIGQYLLKPKN